MQMQNKGGNSTPGAEETAADLEKRRRAEQVDLLQRQFDARIDKVSHQINKQMNALINLMEQCLLRATVDEVTPSETRRGSVESAISSYTALSSEQHKQTLKDDIVNMIDSQEPYLHFEEAVGDFKGGDSDSSPTGVRSAVVDGDGQASHESFIGNLGNVSHKDASKDVGTPSNSHTSPLKHLLRDFENITGPSIKFLTPMTDRRIERIRSLAAERTHSAPPKIYKVLPKLMNKVKQEEIEGQKKAKESRNSAEAVYYEGL